MRMSHRGYDSYFQKYYELTRAVWNRERKLAAYIYFSGLWSMRSQLRNLRSFPESKRYQARTARAAGDLQQSGKPDRRSGCVCPRMADGKQAGRKSRQCCLWRFLRAPNKRTGGSFPQVRHRTHKMARVVALRLDENRKGRPRKRPAETGGSWGWGEAFRRKERGYVAQGFGHSRVIAGIAAWLAFLLWDVAWANGNAQTRLAAGALCGWGLCSENELVAIGCRYDELSAFL